LKLGGGITQQVGCSNKRNRIKVGGPKGGTPSRTEGILSLNIGPRGRGSGWSKIKRERYCRRKYHSNFENGKTNSTTREGAM